MLRSTVCGEAAIRRLVRVGVIFAELKLFPPSLNAAYLLARLL